MRSKSLFFSLILLLPSVLSAIRCSASTAPAPFWLKREAYAYYYVNFTVTQFVNGTTIWRENSTYGWRCVGLTGNIALLEVSANITAKKKAPMDVQTTPYVFQGTFTVNLNVQTREAACGDIYLGFMPYWMPANVEELPYVNKSRLPDWIPPELEWKVIENFSSFEDNTAYGLVGGVSGTRETPYKRFDGDELRSILAVHNTTLACSYIYEKDSGLWVEYGTDNFWRKILEINDLTLDAFLLDTNIHSLPDQPSLLTILLPYVIATVIIIAVAVPVYFSKIRRRTPKQQIRAN